MQLHWHILTVNFARKVVTILYVNAIVLCLLLPFAVDTALAIRNSQIDFKLFVYRKEINLYLL